MAFTPHGRPSFARKAVLDVFENEVLHQHALQLGKDLNICFQTLAEQYVQIGDVCGLG